MQIYFRAELGAPFENLARYNCIEQRIITENDCRTEPYVDFVDVINGVKLKVGAKSGLVCGLEIQLTSIESLQKATLEAPSFTEGRVEAVLEHGKIDRGLNYVIRLPRAAVYDPEGKLLRFGKPDGNGVTLRICKNVYVFLNAEGGINAVTVAIN